MLKAPPETFAALVDAVAKAGKPHLAQQLHDFVRVVRYAPPELVISLVKPLSSDLGVALKALTGTPWQVQESDEEAQPSMLEQEKAEAETLRQSVLGSPLVKAAFEAFPDAELTGYTRDEQRSA